MVVAALILEVIAVTIFILNSEHLVEFELFNTSVLFGATSVIIIVLAVGILVIMKLDKSRDKIKVAQLLEFKKKYHQIKSSYFNDITRFSRAFDQENADIEAKIDYAIALNDIYDSLLKKFSSIKIPDFLRVAYEYEIKHLENEKQVYKKFSMLSKKEELESHNIESNIAHRDYLREIDKLEKRLKLII